MLHYFDIIDDLVNMINDDITTNADCSRSWSFQIVHHEGNNTTSPMMFDVSVQTNWTLFKNISNADFEFLQKINAYFKQKGKNRSYSTQKHSGVRSKPQSHICLPEDNLCHAFVSWRTSCKL